MRGFEPAGSLLADRIRKAGETRGFAVARLLTHWAEVAGPDLAAVTRPVRVGYARGGMGATLTLLVQPAQAPLVQMRLPVLRDRVNACYGYNAISRIHLTQTDARGFAEGQTPFAGPAAAAAEPPPPAPQTQARAQTAARDVADPDFRAALEQLALNVMTRHNKRGKE